MRIFVGEDSPAGCADKYCDDNYNEDERCLKEVDVKVRHRRKKTKRGDVA